MFNGLPDLMKYLYAWRNIAIPANLVTIIACFEIWRNDSLTAVLLLAWVKLFTTLLFITYIHLFRGEIVFFFMNLGMGRWKFYGSMFGIDIVAFAIVVIVIHVVN